MLKGSTVGLRLIPVNQFKGSILPAKAPVEIYVSAVRKAYEWRRALSVLTLHHLERLAMDIISCSTSTIHSSNDTNHKKNNISVNAENSFKKHKIEYV